MKSNKDPKDYTLLDYDIHLPASFPAESWMPMGVQKVSAEWGFLARISAWTDDPESAEKRHGWLPKDLNHGRLDLFFLFLAGAHHIIPTA